MESRKSWRWNIGMAVLCGGAIALSAATSQAQILVSSTPAEIQQGGSAGVTFAISGTSNNVATYTAEIVYDVDNIDTACDETGTCTGCTLDPRLTNQILQVTRSGTNALILFVGDTSPPVASFGDGPMFTCTFSAASDATLGVYSFDSTLLEVADALGDTLEATADYGDITVIAPVPTATVTTAPTFTNTPVHTNTPVPTNTSPPTNTATRTNTPQPTATPPPQAIGADDGCNMNASGGSSMSLLLLLPLVALPLARQRGRGRS